MEKEKSKEKGEEDRRKCYDCWRRRFRREMTEQAGALGQPLSASFNAIITKREEESKELRERLMLLRDETLELQILAGDHYMGRYVEHEKKF
jgi:hypothetical protein